MPAMHPPESIAATRRQFDHWRAHRRRGAPIPQVLWESAVELAREHGVSRASQALGVDYGALKQRLDERSSTAVADSGLVEIMLPSTQQSTECVVELEDGDGTRVRVTVRGNAAEIGSLLASLWTTSR